MPPGAPHQSFLGSYRIRVDDFSTPRDVPFETPALQLLSHTHSDHITGLSAKSFGTRVVCSIDAKHMLLNGEPAKERIAYDNGEKSEKTRPYAHLKIDPILTAGGKWERTHSRDLLRALPLNTPSLMELSDGIAVTITLIDANHCPGAVMFLVEGPQGNFLHTGDRYVPPSISFTNPADSTGENPLKTLDAIFLDTACLLSDKELPGKEDACAGMVKLMSQFPPLTRFFINSWTWGYEDMLKAIGRAFNSQVHVDRYKYIIYTGISDPLLNSIVTRNAESTRFHACERWNRCDQVEHNAAGVVYVNPVTMSKMQWDLYQDATQKSLQRGEQITSLICPLSRHSTLPELQELVKLFKPRLVVPNSLTPELGGLDWACMPRMFGDCMAEDGAAAIIADMRRANMDTAALEWVESKLAVDAAQGEDVEIQNLIGDGAEELVKLWTSGSRTEDKDGVTRLSARNSRTRRILANLERFLGPSGPQLQAKQLGVSQRGQGDVSDDSDCDDAADARCRAAELFFAPNSSSPGMARTLPLKERNVSSNSRYSTPRRGTSPRKSSTTSGNYATTSPKHSKILTVSSVSLSPPFHKSTSSSKERAFHSFFDDLQFGTRSPDSEVRIPLSPRKEFQHPHIATQNITLSKVPRPHCHISSSSAQTRTSEALTIPFAGPSVTPSPPRTSRINVPPTPVSGRITAKEQIAHTTSPPMLDLLKVRKRTSSAAGLNSSTAKRIRSTKSIPMSTSLGAASQSDVATSSSTSSQNIDLPLSATPSNLVPFSHSDAEKQRRQKAKQKQIEIRLKLARALPPDKVTPTFKAKLEMQEKKLAERRAKQKTAVIGARQCVYGDGALSPSPQIMPSGEKSRTFTNTPQNEGNELNDQSGVNWDTSRAYEEEIKRQRRRGLRYPQLLRSEKSFAESQSP